MNSSPIASNAMRTRRGAEAERAMIAKAEAMKTAAAG